MGCLWGGGGKREREREKEKERERERKREGRAGQEAPAAAERAEGGRGGHTSLHIGNAHSDARRSHPRTLVKMALDSPTA